MKLKCFLTAVIITASIITINAQNKDKRSQIKEDTLRIDSGRVIRGNTNIVGDVNASGDFAVKQSLHVAGNATFNDNITINNKLSIGTGKNVLSIAYVPGTSLFPAMLKFSPPAGSAPIGGTPGGGIGPFDSAPNLACLNGQPIPGVVNAFSQMLSITYNPVNSQISGGQLLIGHNGVNAFIETEGSGTVIPNINHPGDLFINRNCNRNVMFFQHLTSFASNETNVVSIDGSLNVRRRMQLGDLTASNFSDLTQSKLYIFNNVSSTSNGILVKHGGAGYGIKIATYTTGVKAFVITNNGTGLTGDGPETFRIEGDGSTSITTKVANATDYVFTIVDPFTNTKNFTVRKDGSTSIAGDYIPAGYKLSVNGSAIFTEVWVKLRTNWPDYVFNNNYALMPIKDLAKYVDKNKHLPGFEEGKYYENNGTNVNTVLIKQQEKIEELMLYIIELEKRLSLLEKQ